MRYLKLMPWIWDPVWNPLDFLFDWVAILSWFSGTVLLSYCCLKVMNFIWGTSSVFLDVLKHSVAWGCHHIFKKKFLPVSFEFGRWKERNRLKPVFIQNIFIKYILLLKTDSPSYLSGTVHESCGSLVGLTSDWRWLDWNNLCFLLMLHCQQNL